MVKSRFDAVHRILENNFTTVIVVKDLSETIAQELDAYVELLKEGGDVYGQTAGLLKATQIIRDHSMEKDLT